jgi:hypothetical protein
VEIVARAAMVEIVARAAMVARVTRAANSLLYPIYQKFKIKI